MKDDVNVQNKILGKTFFWMFLGLLGSGIIAWYTYSSGLFVNIVTSGSFGVLVIVELVAVLLFSFLFRKLPPVAVGILYFIYAMLNGITLSVVFVVYELYSVVYLFAISALVFGILAFIGYKTNKDLNLNLEWTGNIFNQFKEKEDGKVLRQERYYGEMSRSFYVGDNINQEDIKAAFENGVLLLTVPKEEIKDTKKYGYDLFSQMFIANLKENRHSFDMRDNLTKLCIIIIKKAQEQKEIHNLSNPEILYQALAHAFTGHEALWCIKKDSPCFDEAFYLSMNALLEVDSTYQDLYKEYL